MLSISSSKFIQFHKLIYPDKIRWIQSSPNTPASTSKRLPDGKIPSSTDISLNPSLADNVTATYSNATAVAAAASAYASFVNITPDTFTKTAANIFKVHKEAVEAGIFDFSESGYIRYHLNISGDIADQIAALNDVHDSWYYDSVYFSATNWRTIDKGLTSLPRAFGPHVFNRTMFGTFVRKLPFTPILT